MRARAGSPCHSLLHSRSWLNCAAKCILLSPTFAKFCGRRCENASNSTGPSRSLVRPGWRWHSRPPACNQQQQQQQQQPERVISECRRRTAGPPVLAAATLRPFRLLNRSPSTRQITALAPGSLRLLSEAARRWAAAAASTTSRRRDAIPPSLRRSSSSHSSSTRRRPPSS
jgi:hypothetical protein